MNRFSMRNNETGDTIELPPPDFWGRGSVIFNGRAVQQVLYSDVDDSTTLIETGRVFHGREFALWLVEQLRNGVWREQA